MRDNILETVGYLRLNKEGKIARHDGGTIVAVVNDVGWGEESPEIAAQIIATWNAKLQANLSPSKPSQPAVDGLREALVEIADIPPPPACGWLRAIEGPKIARAALKSATETPAQ